MIADRTGTRWGRRAERVNGSAACPYSGYDIAEAEADLVVNPEEADRVKSIFRVISATSICSVGSGRDAEVEVDDQAVANSRRQGARRTAIHESNLASAAEEHPLYREGIPSDVVYAGEQAPIIDDAGVESGPGSLRTSALLRPPLRLRRRAGLPAAFHSNCRERVEQVHGLHGCWHWLSSSRT